MLLKMWNLDDGLYWLVSTSHKNNTQFNVAQQFMEICGPFYAGTN